jgi:hypothetical protein
LVSLAGIEEKFLGNLVQELTLKSERRAAIKLLSAYYRFPTASYQPLLGALRGHSNAFPSLLSELAVISRESDPVLLLYASWFELSLLSLFFHFIFLAGFPNFC